MRIEPSERRPPSDDGLFVIGLIGRAGAGKSAVARALAADGAEVIDADRLGHEVTDTDPGVRAALVAEYGPAVYRDDGALDRAQVAARVFTDAAARGRLDRLVHPRILERIRVRVDALRERSFRGVVVIDAALLLDWHLERGCDAVVAVTAPEDFARERLARARGWSADETRRRRGVQRSDAELSAAADVTLVNDGTEEAIGRAARDAVRALRAHQETRDR